MKSSEFWSKEHLERKVREHMHDRGLRREEAIREITLEVGLPKPPPKPPSPEEIAAGERRTRTYGKVRRMATLLLIVATIIGIAGAVYGHGVEIGTAQCNWKALGSVSPGVHVMITPIYPMELNKIGLSSYFANQRVIG